MIVWHFIKWILRNIGYSIRKTHQDISDGLEYRTIETLFFWALGAMGLTLVEVFIVVGYSSLTEVRPNGWCIVGFFLLLLAHLVYTGFQVMFRCFKRDRAEIFEIIKNSK